MVRRRLTRQGAELAVVDGHVGERMRLRRGLLGLTQTDLGGLLGLSYQQVQKYECGVNSMSAGRLWQVARVLDVPVAYFFDQVSWEIEALASPAGADGAVPAPDSRELVDLAARFQRISDSRMRRRVIDLVGLLAEMADQTRSGGSQVS